ncbi:sce7725 family protein [Fundidesulfovibrio soli]|uniref:sce7725 family protein n=1 Tax=Fundidesulfovibrio soli TaxID=2922716 RepID=UPI001FAF0F00|nr:sce7725 family protein [Fundidesulfovibrio soli]
MYYPYFRGKQFELITIREAAPLLAKSDFVPIIEPVKEALGGLEKTLNAISGAGGKAIVIVNPHHGEHSGDGTGISQLLKHNFSAAGPISAGILLRNGVGFEEAVEIFDEHGKYNPVLIHAGYMSPKQLSQYFSEKKIDPPSVFVEEHAKILYRKHFGSKQRILVRDGFKRQRNADYELVEEFSDLHVTYSELGMTGFGDFLVVGDNYSEGGGPAYAVAIHLTFIDPDNDDVMYVYHFVSDTNSTPTDPAGKFAQALKKLIKKLDSGKSKLLETSAIVEFRKLAKEGHFPGLGYIKKLSMKHHIETIADYFGG